MDNDPVYLTYKYDNLGRVPTAFGNLSTAPHCDRTKGYPLFTSPIATIALMSPAGPSPMTFSSNHRPVINETSLVRDRQGPSASDGTGK